MRDRSSIPKPADVPAITNSIYRSALPSEKVQEKGHVPAMRGGKEEEMGMTVLYLAKNEYVNGQVITVDGGVLNVLGS